MPQPPWLNSLEREGREREREQGRRIEVCGLLWA